MQSKHKQTKCEHSRRNSYRFQLSHVGITILNQRVFEKTISNSSLNSHVYWDTLYLMNIFEGGGNLSFSIHVEGTDMIISEQL